MESLKNRAVKSVFWVTLANIASRILNVIALLVAARVLTKADIGLYGLVSTILMILLVVVSFGYDIWYQKSIDREKYHYHVFVGISLVSIVIIATALFIAAPFMGHYYHSQQFGFFIKIISIYFLLGGITQLFSQHLAKHLEFKYTSASTVARQLTQATVSIVLVFIYKDALALIIGLISGGIIEFLILFVKTRRVFLVAVKSFNPSMLIQALIKDWKLAFSFMGSQVVNTVARMVPPLVFGRTLGLTSTGLFSTMDNLISQPLYLITGSVSTVSLPILAKVETRNLAAASLKISRALLLVGAPLFILLWIFPKEIITLTIGAKWSDGAPILQLLMLPVFFNITVSPISSVFAIRNRPHQLLWWNVVLLVGNIIALVIGSRYGLFYAVAIYAGVNVILRLVLQFMTSKLLKVDALYFLRAYGEYAKLWLPLIAICLAAKYLFTNEWTVVPLAVVVLTLYYVIVRHFYPYVVREAKAFLPGQRKA